MVLCGHGSRTENNPLQAGLDCGACGGHSGEANARFAAKLLNQKHIRESLADRGISIGDDVQFVGALHNTTTDDLQFFDVDQVPQSHRSDLQQLMEHAAEASRSNRSERMGALAGNAAFIAAPRDLTGKVSLAGRSFLHSYDYRSDPDFKVLEQIMTAPMIVANWINLQYYASTVDPAHFGSGNKAIHDVAGRFGILTGNGGDLMTGLPWQSIHDGVNYQHHPLRLLVVLAAPRQAIARVIEKHASIKDLLTHGWLHLIALDEGQYYRFSQRQSWDRLPAESSEGITPELFPSMFRSHQPSN